jgi:beta-lactamase superfamily II metal-dependent hydrolase
VRASLSAILTVAILFCAFLSACDEAPPESSLESTVEVLPTNRITELEETSIESVDDVTFAIRDGFTLWQLPPRLNIDCVMMSYVLLSPHNKVVVIDGGGPVDSHYLYYFIKLLGNHVDAWYLTHFDEDHVGALKAIMLNRPDLLIDKIYVTCPSVEWLTSLGKEGEYAIGFYNFMLQSGAVMNEVNLGDVHNYGGMDIEVLGVKNPEITVNALNNSSMVIRVSDKKKSAIFLGDLGTEEGMKLMNSPYRDRFASDYVQVSHHGCTDGIEPLYSLIKPSFALWPITYDVMWRNIPRPAATKTAQSLVTFFQTIGVKENFFAYSGLCRID